MAMPQCCYLAKGAKRPSHTTNTIKFDRIPFDPCNSIKRFDLCRFDQKNSTYLQPPKRNDRTEEHTHSILLKKLRSLGGSLLKLIASYLQNRVQQVKIENCQSEECPITSGVPQGSVVGLLFFIAFINDLPENCECVPFLFDDDLKLASSSLIELQNDLLSLMKWSEENKLDFNLKKTNLLHFKKSKMQCDDLVLHMGENDIYPTTKDIRDLGVCVSPNLTWTDHINIKIANCYKRLAMIRRNLPKMLKPDMKFKLYRIYILPALASASGNSHPNRGDLKKNTKAAADLFQVD